MARYGNDGHDKTKGNYFFLLGRRVLVGLMTEHAGEAFIEVFVGGSVEFAGV